MNGLVGYGSSDEDDDAPPNESVSAPVTPARQEGPGLVTINGHSDPAERKSRADEDSRPSGPILGPSRPTDMLQTHEEDLSPDLPQMPEHDLLRYLTQPTHPVDSLPPEPDASPNHARTAKFKHFLDLKSEGFHFNNDLAGNSSFKNPNLFALLLDRAGISSEGQYNLTLSVDNCSPHMLPAWAYKEELLKAQQSKQLELEATKKAQFAAGTRTIEFSPAAHAAP
ncbi:hypothetical protein LTS08_002527 [Lithohypha guttulata]|nr:hypothetical protein LTS08_002527 [Lithohypha guttulata]